MQIKDGVVVNLSTLRRDLYFVTSLLLADEKMVKIEGMTARTKDFHESEVSRLLLLIAAFMRGMLDLLGEKGGVFSRRRCGEYWADFDRGEKALLTFRQACNSVIHAREILAYKALHRESSKVVRRAYIDRITVQGVHKAKQTRAQIDIIRFAQTGYDLIDFIQEEDHADR